MTERAEYEAGSSSRAKRGIGEQPQTTSTMNTPPDALSGTGLEALQRYFADDALHEALTLMSELGGSLALNLVRVGAIDETAFVERALAAGAVEQADPILVQSADESLLRLVPSEVISELGMIPLAVTPEGVLLVGVAEPVPSQRLGEAEFFAGVAVQPRMCTASEFCVAFLRITGRVAWPQPDRVHGVASGLLGECLETVEALEEVAAGWVVAHRSGGHHGDSDPGTVEAALQPTPPPTVDDRIVRVAPSALSGDPTPIEPPEVVAETAVRLTLEAEAMSPVGGAPVAEAAAVAPSPSSAVAAAPATSGRAADAMQRAARPARTSDVDGIYGPAASVVDRMGHPTPFVRAVVRNMLRGFQDAATTDELMLELAEGLGLIYPNVVVLSVRAGQLHVWQASLYRGPRTLLGQRFEYEGVEPWDRVVCETQAFRGRLPAGDALRALLGRDLGRDTLLFPLAIRGRAVACVALDSGYELELASAGGQYEAVESAINDALVRILRSRRSVGET